MSETIDFKYRAFISYAHADAKWGRLIHRRLEKFKVSKELVGRQTARGAVPKDLRPIFRDRDDFAGGQSLNDATLAALDDSASLIVLCSTVSAQRRAVNEEVRLFRSRHPERPVIPVILDGNSSTNLPPAVRFKVTSDGEITDTPETTLGIDLREQGDGIDMGLAKMVAGISGLSTDDIVRRAQRDQRRTMRNWIAGLTCVLLVMTGLTVWAELSRRDARNQETIATARQYLAQAQARERGNTECSLGLALHATRMAATAQNLDLIPFRNAIRRIGAHAHVKSVLDEAPTHPLSRIVVSWHPRNNSLYYIGSDGSLRRRSADQRSSEIVRSNAGLFGLAWRPATADLALIKRDSVELWDEDLSQLKSKFALPEVGHFVWSPTGRQFLATSTSGSLLGDLELGTLRRVGPPTSNTTQGRGLAWSPDGQAFAFGSRTSVVTVLKLDGGDARTLEHPKPILDVAWSPNADYIAVGMDDGQVWIWSATDFRRVEILEGHTNQVTSLSFSSGGDRLISASWDQSVRIWRTTNWSLVAELTGHNGPVYQARWRPDDEEFATTSVDGTVRLWTPKSTRLGRVLLETHGWFWNVGWVGAEQLAATADSEVVLVDRTGQRTSVAAGDWLELGRQFVAGSLARSVQRYAIADALWVRVIDLADGTPIFDQRLATDAQRRVMAVSLSSDAKLLATATIARTAVFAVPSGDILLDQDIPSSAVSISPDNGSVAIFNFQQWQIDIFDLNSRSHVRTLPGLPKNKATWGLAWSPDGTRIAAATDDGLVRIWRATGGDPELVLRGHTGDAKTVDWSPDGMRLATGSLDRTIRIWDAASGRSLATIEGFRSGVRSVAWSKDGTNLAAGSEDGTARLFIVDWNEIQKVAEEQVGQGMTPSEFNRCLARPEIGN